MPDDDLTDILASTGLAANGITDRIRADILSGAFGAGHRIKIGELAERYAVSAMPIREALRTLDGEGLLTIIPNKGARVRTVDAKFVRNLYDIRGALESLLVEHACNNMTFRAQQQIEAAQTRLEDAVGRDDTTDLLAANADFHNVLNQLGDNPEAVRILRMGQNLIASFRGQFGFQAGRLAGIAEEHRALMEALWNRDVSRAIAISRMHSTSARDDLIASLKD